MSNLFKPAATTSLSSDEQRLLCCVVGHMIPASAKYGIPGANDDRIFADIIASLDRDEEAVHKALAHISALAGGDLPTLPVEQQSATLSQFREKHPAMAAVLVAVTARCYYRDDRVMSSLGMELRAPFPKGFDVKPGDWSLLDPVRARGKIYRDVGPS